MQARIRQHITTHIPSHYRNWGRHGHNHDRMVVDLQLPVQSVPTTTKTESSNPDYNEVYTLQHYVKKFVSDLQQVSGFLWVLWYPPSIKLTTMIKLNYC